MKQTSPFQNDGSHVQIKPAIARNKIEKKENYGSSFYDFGACLEIPQATTAAIDSYNTPGQVNVVRLEESVADFAIQALSCYHKSARFRGVDILGAPWRDQYKYGADGSVVMRINFMGVSGSGYQMVVAAMAKGRSYRTFVLDENTMVSYNKKCSLEYWTTAEAQ